MSKLTGALESLRVRLAVGDLRPAVRRRAAWGGGRQHGRMTSRRDLPPSWAELLARTAVADVDTARGRWRHSAHRSSYGWFSHAGPPLRAVTPPQDVEVDFVYQRPKAYRLEASTGFLYATDGTTAWLTEPDGEVVSAPASRILLIAGPEALLLPDLERLFPRRRAHPTSVEASSLLGRRAWHARTDQAELWIDDETGVLLKRVDFDGLVSEFTALALEVLTEESIAFEGNSRALEVPAPQVPSRPPPPEPRAVPTISYWPPGVEIEVTDGDPATGAFRGMLRPAWPGSCFVVRTRRQDPHPVQEGTRHISWSTERWNWMLGADEHAALGDADLAAIAKELSA